MSASARRPLEEDARLGAAGCASVAVSALYTCARSVARIFCIAPCSVSVVRTAVAMSSREAFGAMTSAMRLGGESCAHAEPTVYKYR